VLKADHGEEPQELAEMLFPSDRAAREAALRELSAYRIPIQDEELKPRILKEYKEDTKTNRLARIRWQKPAKGKAGELWIAADIGISGEELAQMLFPDDDAGQDLVREKAP
jgi:hypothetical protein